MQVRKNNIARVDRFTISLQIVAEDIPAYTWLLNEWLMTISGDVERQSRAGSVMELIIDWHKNDIGNEHGTSVSP